MEQFYIKKHGDQGSRDVIWNGDTVEFFLVGYNGGFFCPCGDWCRLCSDSEGHKNEVDQNWEYACKISTPLQVKNTRKDGGYIESNGYINLRASNCRQYSYDIYLNAASHWGAVYPRLDGDYLRSDQSWSNSCRPHPDQCEWKLVK